MASGSRRRSPATSSASSMPVCAMNGKKVQLFQPLPALVEGLYLCWEGEPRMKSQTTMKVLTYENLVTIPDYNRAQRLGSGWGRHREGGERRCSGYPAGF